jgi:pimeloyl-ACP methyl ester carboxylesterase
MVGYMKREPVFVLIPGGGMSDWVWKDLLGYLRYPSIMISSRIEPNTYQNRLNSTLKDMVDHIVVKIPADADNLVLVGHSGAGMLAAMTAQSIAPRIKHVVFIAANIPAHNASAVSGLPFLIRWLNITAIKKQIKMDSIPMENFAKMIRKSFLNNAPEEIAQYMLRQALLPEPLCVLNARMNWDGFPDVGKTYVVLSDDHTLSPEKQRQMGRNLNIEDFRVINSCHMAMLTKPEELALILNSVAEA